MRDEYFIQLEERLRKINVKEEDIKEIIHDFKESIRQSMLHGKSEEETLEDLGEPIETAEDYDTTKEIEQVIRESGRKDVYKLFGKRIVKGIRKSSLLIGAFFVEVWILVAQIIAVLIGGSGLLCLSGLVIPYVREQWVRIDVVTSFPMKIFCMILGGVFFSGAGFMWFRLMIKVNKKFYKNVVERIKE